MNKLLLIVTIWLSSILSPVGGIASENIRSLLERARPIFHAMEGVSSTGQALCLANDERAIDSRTGSERCLSITVTNQQSYDSLLTLFPAGIRIEGVLVVVEARGFVPEPRGSVGN